MQQLFVWGFFNIFVRVLLRCARLKIKVQTTITEAVFSDEEIGGAEGMKMFVHQQPFKDLNIAFAMDEGMALLSPSSLHFFSVVICLFVDSGFFFPQ